jgi:hypothetical protein
MNKVAIAIILAVSLVAAAPAQGGKTKPKTKAPATQKLPTELKCPVMKDVTFKVKDAEKAKSYVDYNNKRYYVCCGGCVPVIKKDMKKYSKEMVGFPIPPSPKAPSKPKKG